MRLVNKLLKLFAWIGVRIWIAIQLYAISLVVTTPIITLIACIFDLTGKVPALIQGRYFIAWLIISIIPWIVFNIYTSLQAKKLR